MSLFKVCRGAETRLPSTKTDGYAYFCTDTGSFYIDHKDASNTLVRSKISAQFADKLRYVKDGETIEIDASEVLTASNVISTVGVATIEQNGFMSSTDKTKLDSIPEDAEANVQADWSNNDETSDAYIKNRPFYTTDPQDIEVCNGTYDFVDASEMGTPLYNAMIDVDYDHFIDDVGQEITVVYDGTTYNLISKYIDKFDMYYVGNGSLINTLGANEENTGEPFIYTLGTRFLTSDTDNQHTIQISVRKTSVITIPQKYLGISVWSGEQENSIVLHTEDNVASGFHSLATGSSTTASGNRSHAEGNETTASGDNSHAEGNGTTASSYNAHAEGVDTIASGHTSHAEGVRTEASGQGSHTEGQNTKASAWNAHAEGQGTEAAAKSQHVLGEYNIVDKSTSVAERGKYIQIAGNGGSENAKSNAYTLDWNGNAWFEGSVKVGGTGQDDAAAKTLATTAVATTTSNGLMASTDKSKLDGIESGANKTTVDTALSSTSTNPVQNKAIHTALAGKADLDDSGKVPTSQLPSYVDDVLEYANKSSFPSAGETGKIYVDTTTNKTYRWSGSMYVEISASLAIGITSSTAAAGDHGHAYASTTTSGFMSSTDKEKLDSIPDELATILDTYILNIDYDLLAFDVNEIIINAINTTSVLGQAILGQMVLA